jgi:hypothetical protein
MKTFKLGLMLSLICTVTYPVLYIVDTTADVGMGSLRQAILDSNGNAGPNIIEFQIPGVGPFTIQPLSDLPRITTPVDINGYSQTGASINNLSIGNNANILIIINGSNYTVGNITLGEGNGLTFGEGSTGSSVRGLCINEWINCGILIDGFVGAANDIVITGNFIGTNVAGTAAAANRIGIGISGDSTGVGAVSGTIIGSDAEGNRNLIAGSFGFIIIDPYLLRGACISLFDTVDTSIVGNYIGVDRSGTQALGNSQVGVYFRFVEAGILGTTGLLGRNIISGHMMYGARIRDSFDCIIENNYFGTNVFGNAGLPNNNQGIYFDGEATTNTLRNNLSSSNGYGLRLGTLSLPGTENNTIIGNLFGTDFSGTQPLGNTHDGVIVNSPNNTIGGNGVSEVNVSSDNGNNGVTIYSTNNVTVQNNHIGVDIIGNKAMGNGNNGVQIGLQGALSGASNNTI